MHRRGRLAMVVVAVVAAACGGGDTGAPDEAETLAPAPTDASDEPDEESSMPADDDPQAFAIADAAGRAGVDPAEVRVVVDEQVTWPDGALGCPQPDQFYTQALVEGYRLVVEAGGQEYHYHGQSGQPPAYCENPSPPADDGRGVVDR